MSKVARICDALDDRYGKKQWADRGPVLDELIRTVLSQNTTAGNCAEAFKKLRQRFPAWEDARDARWQEIAQAIRSGGLANRKAPRIRAILSEIDERGGVLDLEWIADLADSEALDYLMAFEGVGRKTAACVLMFALGRSVLPVDTHVHRVATCLGLIGKVDADKAHDLLQQLVPPERVYSFHVNTVLHGRQICRARRPQCDRCAIRRNCDYFVEKGGLR